MFAGQIYDRQKIRLVDVPEPKLGPRPADGTPGEILFQPELACLCGSDLTFFQADYPEFKPSVGQSLHEMIGRVVDTNGSRFQPGDRVLCVPVEHFGFWQRYCVSELRAIPVDPRPRDDQAVMAQPLGTVLFALRKLPNLLDLNVVVVGQGPIGLLFDGVLRNLGARQIIAIEPLADRRAVGERMGATTMIDPTVTDPIEAVRELTGGKMADLVVEAVGHREQVLNHCVDLCRPFGTILFFGVPPKTIDGIRMLDIFSKNLQIVTSVGPDFTKDFPLAMRWIAEGRLDVNPIITHRFPVAEIQQAFDTYFHRRDGAIKVFLDFPAA